MPLAITIQGRKFKKKLNYGKMLGLPRPTTLNHVIIINTKVLLTQAYVTLADFDSPI
jgi:hypothetical protein